MYSVTKTPGRRLRGLELRCGRLSPPGTEPEPGKRNRSVQQSGRLTPAGRTHRRPPRAASASAGRPRRPDTGSEHPAPPRAPRGRSGRRLGPDNTHGSCVTLIWEDISAAPLLTAPVSAVPALCATVRALTGAMRTGLERELPTALRDSSRRGQT